MFKLAPAEEQRRPWIKSEIKQIWIKTALRQESILRGYGFKSWKVGLKQNAAKSMSHRGLNMLYLLDVHLTTTGIRS